MHYAGVANCWVLQLAIHLFQNTGSEDHLKVKSKLTHYVTSVYYAPLTLTPGIGQIRSSPILGQSCLQPNAMKPIINVS